MFYLIILFFFIPFKNKLDFIILFNLNLENEKRFCLFEF